MIQWLLVVFWASMFLSQSLMDLMATVVAFAGLWEIWKYKKAQGSWPRPPRGVSILLLSWLAVLAVGLFAIAPPEAPRWEDFLEFRWMLELGLWIFLLSRNPFSRKHFGWLLAPLLANAVFGLVTWWTGASPLEPGVFIDRVGGLFNNPMPFAQSMGPSVAVLGGLILSVSWRDRDLQRWILPTFLLVSLSVLFSYTRGVWAGVFVAALILPCFAFPKKGWLLSLLVAAASVAFVFAVPSLRERVTQSFDEHRSYDGQRVVLWRTNLEMFKDSPLFGLGYSENGRRLPEYFQRLGVPPEQFKSHAHNQYLHFLSGTGLFGLACYLGFLGYFLWQNLLLLRRPSGNRWLDGLTLGLLGGQIAFEVGSMTESNFSVAKNRAVLLVMLALLMAVKAWRVREGSPQKSVPPSPTSN